MHTDLFNDLTQSLKEATAIAKGAAEPRACPQLSQIIEATR